MKNTISKNSRIQNKRKFKKMQGKCRICGETNLEILDVHRMVVPGGVYRLQNTCVICVSCHRKEQAGQIKIIGWVDSTLGQLLHYIDENGQEQFS